MFVRRGRGLCKWGKSFAFATAPNLSAVAKKSPADEPAWIDAVDIAWVPSGGRKLTRLVRSQGCFKMMGLGPVVRVTMVCVPSCRCKAL